MNEEKFNIIGARTGRFSAVNKVDVIEYLHKCLCGRVWYSEMKISHCPKCRRQHIWFNDTSRIKE